MTAGLGVVLAHQGGWDEILLIAGPILVIAALLALAKRRVDRLAAAAAHHDAGEPAGHPTGHPVGRPVDGTDGDDRSG